MIRLYQTQTSPYCHRVRIVLAEKGLDYQIVPIELSKGDHKTAQFLRLNPIGKVPVLSDEDFIVSESLVINEYLDEEYPYPELMPEAPQDRALVRLWTSFVDQKISNSFMEFVYAGIAEKNGEDFDQTRIERARTTLLQFLEVIERQLKDKQYLVGSYSLADIAFAPWISRFDRFQIAIPDTLPQFKAWMKRLAAKSSIAGTL